MFKHLRGALPACALAAASLFAFMPAASAAASTPTPAIYTDADTINRVLLPGGYVWTYDGSGSPDSS